LYGQPILLEVLKELCMTPPPAAAAATDKGISGRKNVSGVECSQRHAVAAVNMQQRPALPTLASNCRYAEAGADAFLMHVVCTMY
jgi:tRNA U38,U39,U40 pseudouridine synthase TruA